MEGVVAVEDPGAPGGVPGELQGRLHRLGAAVAEEDPVQVRAVREQLLGQQPGQRLAVEPGQVGELGVQDVVQGAADDRVVPAQAHHPEPGQHVQVVVALRVPEVGALGPLVDLVEADGVQHAGQLVVEVPGVQLVPLRAALGQQGAEVEALAPAAPLLLWPPGHADLSRLLAIVSRAARRDSLREPMVARTAVGS